MAVVRKLKDLFGKYAVAGLDISMPVRAPGLARLMLIRAGGGLLTDLSGHGIGIMTQVFFAPFAGPLRQARRMKMQEAQ